MRNFDKYRSLVPYPVRVLKKTDFYSNLENEVGFTFTEKQKEIIEYSNGRSQVLATAGSGKTTTINAKIGWMVLEEEIPANKILAMSYSKAAAKDFGKRYKKMFPYPEAEGVKFSTIHAFAYRVIQEQYRIQKKQLILIEGSNAPLDKQKYLRQIYYNQTNKYLTAEKMKALTTDISYVKNKMIKADESNSEFDCFKSIFNKYEAMKQSKGYIDFDDMLSECYRLLSESEAVRQYYSNKFTHLVLDEAQDVSFIQAEIGKLLSAEFENMTLIGDDDQSIYFFRGADPNLLIQYGRKFRDTVVFELDINYRCAPNILEHAKNLIAHNTIRLEKGINASKTENGVFDCVPFENVGAQYDEVIAMINKMDGDTLDDCAILFRNNISAVPLINGLYKKEIPFYVNEDKIGFFNEWVVRGIVNMLKFTQELDNIELFQMFGSRLGLYLSDEIYLKIQSERTSEYSLLETIANSKAIPAKLKTRVNVIKKAFQTFSFKSVPDAIRFVTSKRLYGEYIDNRDKKGDYGNQSSKLIIDIMLYLGRDTSSIDEYRDKLNGLRECAKNIKKLHGKKGVSLMTLHGSKGLEFDTVFMVDMIDDLFPSKSAKKKKTLLEEERRLCYVGVTRAKEKAYIFYDKNKESKFIDELKNRPVKADVYGHKKHAAGKIKNASNKGTHSKVREGTAINDEKQLKSGISVLHNTFGAGKVTLVDKEKIVIAFDSVGAKTLLLSFVINNEIIRLDTAL